VGFFSGQICDTVIQHFANKKQPLRVKKSPFNREKRPFIERVVFCVFDRLPGVRNDDALGISIGIVGFDHLRVAAIVRWLLIALIHRRDPVVRCPVVDELIGIILAIGWTNPPISLPRPGSKCASILKPDELAPGSTRNNYKGG
jgi:hypothetical protein